MENLNRTGYILRELKEPEITTDVISLFPETIGWKILVIITLIVIIVKLINNYKEWKNNQYRREAKNEVLKIKDHSYQSFKYLSRIINVTANYSLETSRSINTISPNDKVKLLNKSCNNNCFDVDLFLFWQESLLKGESNFKLTKDDMDKIKSSTLYWIKNHERGAV